MDLNICGGVQVVLKGNSLFIDYDKTAAIFVYAAAIQITAFTEKIHCCGYVSPCNNTWALPTCFRVQC